MTYRNPPCPMCGTELIPESKIKSYRIDEYHCWKQWLGQCPKCKDSYKWGVNYEAYESEEPEYIEHFEE